MIMLLRICYKIQRNVEGNNLFQIEPALQVLSNRFRNIGARVSARVSFLNLRIFFLNAAFPFIVNELGQFGFYLIHKEGDQLTM